MRKSYVWAGVICLGIGAWLASPKLLPMITGETAEAPVSEAQASAAETASKPFRVRVKTFTASPRSATVSARGITEASARVDVRARTNGVIVDQPLRQGAAVKVGDRLCGLDMMNRKAQLAQAEAALASSRRDYEAATKLSRSGFVADARLAQQKAALDGARAALEQINWDIAQMTINSPVEGVLIDKPAEAGSLLSPGGLCATVSVIDPILVTSQVSEQHISYVVPGMVAKAKLATGEEVEGKIRFIAVASDVATRTFKVELEVPNPGNRLRSGVSADVMVDMPPVAGQFLPSSILGLNDKGQFGVRVLNGDNTTTFTAVTVISQERDGVWVTGLPPSVQLVVVGQDYVKDGDEVEPVAEVASVAQ